MSVVRENPFHAVRLWRGPLVAGFLAVAGAWALPASAQDAAGADAVSEPAASLSMLPENISTYGGDVDWLFNLILVITTITLIGVLALMAIFMVKYRYREGRKAVYTHGSHKLEVFWTLATAVILIFLAFVQRDTWIRIKQEFPDPKTEEVFVNRVFGEQFNWHFVYPGTDGKFEPTRLQDQFPGFNPVGLANPSADKVLANLHVPVNTKVLLQINSLSKYDQESGRETAAVLHSFFAPNLRVKQDLVPYYPGYIWFEATKTGTYEIACAELCGQGHYTMRADLVVMTNEELQQQLGYDWRQHRATFEGVDKRTVRAPRRPAPVTPGD